MQPSSQHVGFELVSPVCSQTHESLSLVGGASNLAATVHLLRGGIFGVPRQQPHVPASQTKRIYVREVPRQLRPTLSLFTTRRVVVAEPSCPCRSTGALSGGRGKGGAAGRWGGTEQNNGANDTRQHIIVCASERYLLLARCDSLPPLTLPCCAGVLLHFFQSR